jgi:hypothetical protein
MFSPLFFAGLVLLVAGVIGGRFLGERATKLLTPQEKLILLDSFSRLRVFGSLPLLFVFFSFFGIGYLPAAWMWPAYFAAWALVAIYFVIVHRLVSRRLRELAINPDFQKAHAKARWMSYFGFLAFFILNTLSPFVWR